MPQNPIRRSRVFRHLLAGPVVVRAQLLGGIVDFPGPLLPDVGRREHHRPLDARGIEQRDQVVGAIGVMGVAGGAGEISAASAGLNRCWWWSASGASWACATGAERMIVTTTAISFIVMLDASMPRIVA